MRALPPRGQPLNVDAFLQQLSTDFHQLFLAVRGSCQPAREVEQRAHPPPRCRAPCPPGEMLHSRRFAHVTVYMWAESGVAVLHSHSRGVREAVKVLTSRCGDRDVWPWGRGCGPEKQAVLGRGGSEVTGFLGQ